MLGAALPRAARRVARRHAYSAPFVTRASAIVRCETRPHAGSAQFANWDSNTVLKPISLQILCAGQPNYFQPNPLPAILFRISFGRLAREAGPVRLRAPLSDHAIRTPR